MLRGKISRLAVLSAFVLIAVSLLCRREQLFFGGTLRQDDGLNVTSSPGPPRRRFPDVIIAGVKKCGTSSLRMQMSMHSRTVVVRDELHFFDSRHHPGRPPSSYQCYLKQFPMVTDDKVLLEKTPRYFITPTAPEEIREIGSSVILIVRNPVTRVFSDYRMIHYKRQDVPDRIEELIFTSDGQVDKDEEIIIPSLYSDHMPRWLEHFPLGKKLHIVDGDNFVQRPWEEMVKLQDFLGLPREINRSSYYKRNKDKHFWCWKFPLRNFCMSAHGHLNSSLGNSTLRRRLGDFFRPYNERLFRMLGRRFDWEEM